MKLPPWSILAVACASFASCLPRTTPIRSIETVKGGQLSHNQLRGRVIHFTSYAARTVSQAGAEIAKQSEDPAIRHNTLVWRIYAVTELRTAGAHANPVMALLDTWGLCTLMLQLLERDGEEFFGEHQAIALEAAREIEREIEALARSSVGEKPFTAGREGIHEYAQAYPLEDLHMARWGDPGKLYLEFQADSGADVLSSVASVEDRLTLMAMQLPGMLELTSEVARWQAELVVLDLLGSPTIAVALREFHDLSEAAREADELAIEQREIATRDLLQAADEQRLALTEVIDQQRQEVGQLVTSERIAALAQIDEQRTETIALLQGERQLILDSVDATVDQALDQALDTIPARIQEGVDAFWLRAVQIGGALLLVGGAAAFLAARSLVDRARRA